jgi:hypothetical protein
MPSIYEMGHTPEVRRVLDSLREVIYKSELGATLSGNRLTLRWAIEGQLVNVQMVILEVTTPDEAEESMRSSREFREIIEKYKKKAPDLEAELYHVSHNEWPQ